MKLRLVLLVLAAMLLFSGAQAVTKDDPDGLSVHFNMKNLDEWVFVTPENYLEHMDLCLSRGSSAEDVHERFASGRIVWEGYYTKLPEGCIRYEKWSDAYTRNVWGLEQINAAQRKELLTEIEEIWSAGRYTYFNTFIKTQNTANKKHGISYAFTSNPPLAYESGLGMLTVQNGVAMSLSYVQFASRASAKNYLKDDNTWSNMSRVYFYDHVPDYTNLERQTPCVDLLPGDEWIVNMHTGMEIALTAVTEKGAQAAVVVGDKVFQGAANDKGNVTFAIRAENEGLIDAVYRVSRNKQQDNTLTVQLPVNNAKAALVLTQYPLGEVAYGKSIVIAGKTTNAASVSVQLDGEEAVTVPVKDGEFTHIIAAEPWRLREVTVTAVEDGKEDAAVTLPFCVQYENIEQGIRDFKKAMSKVNCRQLAEAPDAYIGELVKMEFYTKAMQYTDVGIAYEANGLYNNKKYPMILLADGYMNDMIVEGMYITAYGIVSEPTLTDDPMPRIQLVYVTYQKKTYK